MAPNEKPRSSPVPHLEPELHSAIFEAVGALVIVLDPEARIVLFNPACEQLTGYRFEEVKGRLIWDLLLSPEELPGVRAVFAKLTAGDFPSHYENDWITRDGERRRIVWSNTAVLGPDGTVRYVIGTGIDITERKRLGEELSRSKTLAAIGEMAASIAHEIKNPLTGISLALQNLRDSESSGSTRSLIEEILAEVARLDGTMKDLLTFAKSWEPKKDLWNLREIAERVAGLTAGQDVFRRVRFRFEGPEDVKAPVDRAMVEQVLWNLYLNSAEAMREGGEILTSIQETSGTVTIAIADEGPGMPPELEEKLFQPFFTTKSSGTGLGLPNCLRMVEAHGGSIAVDRVPGGGARVTALFPKSM